jgi:hypothetical protein
MGAACGFPAAGAARGRDFGAVPVKERAAPPLPHGRGSEEPAKPRAPPAMHPPPGEGWYAVKRLRGGGGG